MKQLKIIGLAVLLMIAAVIIVGRSITATDEIASLETDSNSLKSEREAVVSTVNVLDKMNIIDKNKSGKFKKNRAYQGAPPTIPHEVYERNMGDNSCLQCHLNGGYVDKFKAHAPIVPHPEMVNCRQCHVAVKINTVFKESNWESMNNIPQFSNKALPTSPPVIPHPLEKNDDCLSCHAGLGLMKIRVTHPERTNCKQCHVLKNNETKDIGEFVRNPKMNN
ncbi:MAG: nitrate reductase cytochrome c-type subunit [Flavobacteriaceae bacterium]|jgi:cytochrome c-type protein NapB|nr:nitrate reductase cytochrome c-type subunit [Flavobacteriaceae bacterium]